MTREEAIEALADAERRNSELASRIKAIKSERDREKLKMKTLSDDLQETIKFHREAKDWWLHRAKYLEEQARKQGVTFEASSRPDDLA